MSKTINNTLKRFSKFEQSDDVQVNNEDAPVNAIAHGGVDMAPNAGTKTKVFLKRKKKIEQPVKEQDEMERKKYLDTKDGSLEDAVLRALNPNAFRETLSMPEKEEEQPEETEVEEAHNPDHYDASKKTQVGSKQKNKPNYNTKTHRLIVKNGSVKVISRDQWTLRRKEMAKQGWGLAEDNTNNKSDDGEGLDKVQPKALKKKFKDRKDKDIDNDGDTDSSDKYLHKRRKAISKAMDEAHEIGTDEYAQYTRDMTPGQDVTNESDRPKWGSNLHGDDGGMNKRTVSREMSKKSDKKAYAKWLEKKRASKDSPEDIIRKRKEKTREMEKELRSKHPNIFKRKVEEVEVDETLDPEVRRKMKERQKDNYRRDMDALKRRHASRMLRLSGKDKASGLSKNEEVELDEKKYSGRLNSPEGKPRGRWNYKFSDSGREIPSRDDKKDGRELARRGKTIGNYGSNTTGKSGTGPRKNQGVSGKYGLEGSPEASYYYSKQKDSEHKKSRGVKTKGVKRDSERLKRTDGTPGHNYARLKAARQEILRKRAEKTREMEKKLKS